MYNLFLNYLINSRLSKKSEGTKHTIDDSYFIFFLNFKNRKFCIFDFYVYERSEKLSVKNGNFDDTYNRLIMQVLLNTLYFGIVEHNVLNQDAF